MILSGMMEERKMYNFVIRSSKLQLYCKNDRGFISSDPAKIVGVIRLTSTLFLTVKKWLIEVSML